VIRQRRYDTLYRGLAAHAVRGPAVRLVGAPHAARCEALAARVVNASAPCSGRSGRSQPHNSEETRSQPHNSEETRSQPHNSEETRSQPHNSEETRSQPHNSEETRSQQPCALGAPQPHPRGQFHALSGFYVVRLPLHRDPDPHWATHNHTRVLTPHITPVPTTPCSPGGGISRPCTDTPQLPRRR
jgi:hypothetical protein